jgi:2,3-bisphosphoglycerate-independent phosphoglycerate mutase
MLVNEKLNTKYAFELDKIDNPLGVYLDNLGYSQLRIAETEKYAHVTYFFDGGIEKELDGCKRELIPSPKVATYDLQPEMSAKEITDKLLRQIEEYDVVILNFANGDMVGHTGVIDAAIKAVETVDSCLGKIMEKMDEIGGTLIVTADHGNCDWMLDENDNVITSHSTYPVPFIINQKNIELKDGKLADIAPTIIKLLDLPKPLEMTGDSLIK